MSKEFQSHDEFVDFMNEMNSEYEDYIVDCGKQTVTSPITGVSAECYVYQINNDDSITTVAFTENGRLFVIV